MDILETEVNFRELQSLDNDLRETFPEGGMTCKVLQCPDREKLFKEHTE